MERGIFGHPVTRTCFFVWYDNGFINSLSENVISQFAFE